MRNRAVEIFLEPLSTESDPIFGTQFSIRPEATLQRYRQMSKILDLQYLNPTQTDLINRIALDNLAWSDLPLLTRYAESVAQNLEQQGIPTARLSTISRQYMQLYQSEDSRDLRNAVGDLLNKVAKKTLLPAGFSDAQVSDRAVPFIVKQCTDSANKICRSSILSKTRHWCHYCNLLPMNYRFIGLQHAWSINFKLQLR